MFSVDGPCDQGGLTVPLAFFTVIAIPVVLGFALGLGLNGEPLLGALIGTLPWLLLAAAWWAALRVEDRWREDCWQQEYGTTVESHANPDYARRKAAREALGERP